MSKAMAALMAFMKYAPYAVAGAQAAESAIGAGNGAAKKQAVIAGIINAAHIGETVPIAQVAAISAVVDLVVSTLNAAGVFGKVAQAVVVPAAKE